VDIGYPISTRTLDNGLRVVVCPDPSTPVAAVNLWYDVGSRDEEPGQFGWAHLFEHLMFQGSAHVASGEHLQSMQAVGGTVNGTTSFDRTNYYETIPSGALDLALWLEGDRMASLTDCLNDENLATQRDVVKEEKRQRYDNVPYGDTLLRLIWLVFPPDHPYGHATIGELADLDSATPKAARKFFTDHYQPSNAVLSIVGDVTAKDAFKRADKYLGWVPDKPVASRAVPAPLPPLEGIPREEVWADVPADCVSLAWRLPAEDTRDYDALEVGFAVLADGQASRLYRDMVRDRGLASMVQVTPLGMIGGTSLGLVAAVAADGVGTDQLESDLLAHVEALIDKGPTPQEVSRALIQHERGWLGDLASLESRADLLGEYATLYGDPALVNNHLERMRRVTPDDVRRACADYLAPGARAVLTYRAAQPGDDAREADHA